tara:strand:+ start:183 stop:443 length:261 start_codon:yes stop_codon:yes gene_type:complete
MTEPTQNSQQQAPPSGSSELILMAIKSKLQAKRDTAVAQLSVYVNSHVGVPDHPNVVDECLNLVSEIAEAEDGLRVVSSIFMPRNA